MSELQNAQPASKYSPDETPRYIMLILCNHHSLRRTRQRRKDRQSRVEIMGHSAEARGSGEAHQGWYVLPYLVISGRVLMSEIAEGQVGHA